MAELYRYAAFISYSSKDAKFAQRLHRALESYGIPSSLGKFDLIGGGKKNRIYPVFRDREELSAGHLGDQIEANLRASAALIVVCSPNGAASPWVQKEIEYFVSLGRRDRVFAVISDAAPSYDASGHDNTATCFPPAFRGDALSGDPLEPLAADARKDKDGFRGALLKVIAGLIGVSPGTIIDRDKKRRRAQLLQSVAVWAAVALVAGYAYMQRSTLEPLFASWTKYRPYVVELSTLVAAAPGTTFQDCRNQDCPVMVVLPEGRFLMGSAMGDPEMGNEVAQHEVAVSRLAVSQNEITFANWGACVASGGCNDYMPDRSTWEGDDRPVINVSWEDAQAYVQWLSAMTGQEYRLLTSVEWEYGARGVTVADVAHHSRFSWGNADPVCDPAAPNGAAFIDCPDRATIPVGSFRPNAFGLHDMHGNVWEWVDDCYDNGSTCSYRVVRGGAFPEFPIALRSAQIHDFGQSARGSTIGFRVARTLEVTS
jgi:formylglycine-generating enzyme required for sulfatase activity